MTRDEARAAGLRQYTPVGPCTHGHKVNRYVGNNDCVKCSAIRSTEYAKAHREEGRLRAEKWRRENPERHRSNARNSIARDPQRNRDRVKQWAEDNPERAAENAKRNYERNRARRISQALVWAKNNPGKRRAIMASNRVRRKNACVPLSPDAKDDLKRIYEECPPGYEVDHIFPINRKDSCGLHVPWNLQYLSRVDNQEKGNKLPKGLQGLAFSRVITR